MSRVKSKEFSVTIRLPNAVAEASPAFYNVAGVMVLTRLILGAANAGANDFTVVGTYAGVAKSRCSNDPRLEKLQINWKNETPDGTQSDVCVEANVVVGDPVWQEISQSGNSVFVPGAPMMIRSGDKNPTPLWATKPASGCYVIALRTQDDVVLAKNAIFTNVSKSTSGPISRNLNSLISIPISRFLCEIGVTPNQMTLVTTIVGLVSAWFVARGTLVDVAIGGTLFQLCAALDRVDGELARSTFRSSRIGAWIDTLGDNLVYLTFMICLIIGYHQYAQTHGLAAAGWILPLGMSMVFLFLVMVGGMTWYLVDNKQPGTMTAVHQDLGQKMVTAQTNWLFRILDRIQILGKRDSFSFAVFLLSIAPIITGHPWGYHLLFWLAMITILFISIHFAMAMIISRKHTAAVASQER
jgi:phosphatidylglycerophosphate synthase